jgi:hypothetical protein
MWNHSVDRTSSLSRSFASKSITIAAQRFIGGGIKRETVMCTGNWLRVRYQSAPEWSEERPSVPPERPNYIFNSFWMFVKEYNKISREHFMYYINVLDNMYNVSKFIDLYNANYL